MSRRKVRLLVVPALLFATVAGATFALAELHLAKPEAPAAAGPVQLGDPDRGEAVFQDTCAGCHGQGGAGGGIGPALAGNPISVSEAKATIDAGRGAMPAGLVSGRDQRDVLAYLSTILR